VAFVAAYPEESVFETTALQIGFEFPVYMLGQGFTLLGQLVHQSRVVRIDELVEKCLLRLMGLVGGVVPGIPAWRQHVGLTPTSVMSKPHTMKQAVLAWNI
jgi:hypothetical protein